jgi:hypothetical protein
MKVFRYMCSDRCLFVTICCTCSSNLPSRTKQLDVAGGIEITDAPRTHPEKIERDVSLRAWQKEGQE